LQAARKPAVRTMLIRFKYSFLMFLEIVTTNVFTN
jgi:hypothetical protein